MNRPPLPAARLLPIVAALATAAVFSAGCGGTGDDEILPQPTSVTAGDDGTDGPPSEEKEAILRGAIRLIQTAYEDPGGTHFDQAIELLAQYFAGTPPQAFALEPATREFLAKRLPDAGLRDLERPTFTRQDARYIEDCLLYQTIAQRAAGDGDDLTRVTRIFDWMNRQVMLIPAGSLSVPAGIAGPEALPQAQARPYDVLLRGMAVEQGEWAERSWLFMALCRQIGVDVGLLRYMPAGSGSLLRAPAAQGRSDDGPITWICVALIEGKPYLFDARIGMPIPGPNGQGIATLDQAVSDPAVLAQLDLPGQSRYPTKQADLAGATFGVWVDSSIGLLSPRMRELQEKLAGRYRMILYRDTAAQDAAFRAALGKSLARTDLYPLPMEVEYLLFNDAKFVTSAQFYLQIFDSRWPLLAARMGQLHGDLETAVQQYVNMRFADNPVEADGKTPIPPQAQAVIDLIATYYLGLAKLDQDEPSLAADFFSKTMGLLPEPTPAGPYYAMFRWGAEGNLARLREASGDSAEAVRLFTQDKATSQQFGDLLRARDLIWDDPFTPTADIPPVPAPAPTSIGQQASAPPQ